MGYQKVSRRETRLRNQVPVKFLSKMAFMGLDGSFAALEGRKNCQSNIDRCNAVRRYRPRYEAISIPPNEGKSITQYIPSDLLDIPFRAIVQPMGKGGFLRLSETLPRSITVRQVVEHIHGDGDLNQAISHVSQFKSQAIASISFHSQVFNRYGATHFENDVLDYVFEEGQREASIQEEILGVHQPIGNLEFKADTTDSDPYHPIKNLTVDAMYLLGRWKNTSFQQIIREAQFFPRFLGLSSRPMDLKDPEYPLALKKLSVFCLGSISGRKNVTDKMEILHKVGFCNIEDLVILSDNFRPIFFNARIRKKLASLGEARSTKENQYKGVIPSNYPENSSAALWQLITIMGYSDGEFRTVDEKKVAKSSIDLICDFFNGHLDDATIEAITEQTINRMKRSYSIEQLETYLYEAASCITKKDLQRFSLSVLYNVLMADGEIATEEMWVYDRLHEMWGLEGSYVHEDFKIPIF